MNISFNLRVLLFPAILLLQTIYSWVYFYNARLLEYDDNYGLLIHAFIISLAALIILIIIRLRKKYWTNYYKYPVIVWLIVGSPVTFLIAGIYYQDIFNAHLLTGSLNTVCNLYPHLIYIL